MSTPDQRIIGSAYATAAFCAWGGLPVYFKAIAHVPPLQVLSHRVVWSVLLLAVLVTLLRRWPLIRAALANRRTVLMLLGSTMFICVNWLTFIWAVQAERVMEISIGYYVTPLVNVVLGVAVLRERLNGAQKLSVALAAVGVAYLAIQTTGVPWPPLAVAISFGFYGLIRKTTSLDSIEGLFLETSLMTPLALAYLAVAAAMGFGVFGTLGIGTDLLLLAAGPATALPLIWFASGARRITMIAIGFFQYLAPTGHFLLSILVFGERFTSAHLLTFACIWGALAIYSVDSVRRSRRIRRERVATTP